MKKQRTPLQLLSFILIVLLAHPTAFAEGGAGGAEDNPLFNDPNQFPQGTIQPEQPDRKDNGKKANVAAIVGAAVAGAMCAIMMAKAMQMEPGPERDQMMMQALQQCAQAAQNAANAAENGNNAEQITSKPETPPSELPAATGELAKEEKSEIPQIALGGDEDPEIEVPTVEEVPTISEPPPIEVPGEGPGLVFGEDPGPVVPGSSIPNPVRSPKLTVDESGDKKTPQTPSPGGTGLLASDAFGSDSGTAEQELEQLGIDAQELRHKKEGGTDFGNSASSGAGGGDSDGDDLLSAFMGGAADGGGLDAPLGGGSGELLTMPMSANPKDKKPKVNIFEYAKFRYKKLAYKQGRIKTRVFVGQKFSTAPQTASVAQ